MDAVETRVVSALTAQLGRLSVDGAPYMHVSATTDQNFQECSADLRQDCFYFTYPS